MPVPFDTAVFYAVFVAPGFIAVMTVISLAAIEDDHSSSLLPKRVERVPPECHETVTFCMIRRSISVATAE